MSFLINKFKKIFDLTDFEKDVQKHPEMYKVCPDCNGLGFEDMFINCETCEGNKFVRKTYQEYVDSLPNLKE